MKDPLPKAIFYNERKKNINRLPGSCFDISKIDKLIKCIIVKNTQRFSAVVLESPCFIYSKIE